MAKTEGPQRPAPQPVELDRARTAVLVLDLSARCHDPKQVCSKLMSPCGAFLEKVRTFSVPIVYTISASAKGTAEDAVAAPLKRRPSELVLYPDGYDKFTGGELDGVLKKNATENLIVLGSSTNVAVLYTSTSAARVYRYRVILPVDGVNAASAYEQEYSFHQLSVLPGGVSERIRFTTLSQISFRQ